MAESQSILPRIIYVFSGKRKSGKDFVTMLLQKRFGSRSIILRLSGPLKEQYAKQHNLDYNRLLDATEYKEQHRAAMIKWGEEMRKKDKGYFCRLAIREAENHHDVWIISDARRKSDIEYFKKEYPKQMVTVRVEADLEIRIRRGLVPTKGIDDAPSECGLDKYSPWDVMIRNNGGQEQLHLEKQLEILAFMAERTEKDDGDDKAR
ncbi:putative phosphomevalonate kinase-like [Apostichopus japonicus]|uniref:Phosphomevalonate kinase n=1 Tax=Stichopus japonicus TaxID=307972 RepID=A0A2G8LPL1_STIJA|nr:putative phosphomevalonate kinase-like [Apostichopus japonicus]